MANALTTLPAALSWDERLHYRDRLRSARYAALADAEGFGEVCFALEALGLRLRGEEANMGQYGEQIRPLAAKSPTLNELALRFPSFFTRFDALFDTVKGARNDAMHAGTYARHATTAAIALCIGLEEVLMNSEGQRRRSVADFMVKLPISIERWQPVAHARQLMLTHSFSFLPVMLERWMLVSEIAMAKFLRRNTNRKQSLATSIETASTRGLDLVVAKVVNASAEVDEILVTNSADDGSTLWLITDSENRLSGVLTPFELM